MSCAKLKSPVGLYREEMSLPYSLELRIQHSNLRDSTLTDKLIRMWLSVCLELELNLFYLILALNMAAK